MRVGLSGGLDSTVLLHLLASLRPVLGFALAATHVRHGLVAGSEAWADGCRTLCEALDVPFSVCDVEVERRHPGGLEAAARAARRAALLGLGDDWLVLAHHRDDQAETVLFRAIRGAGVRGAAGMRACVPGDGEAGLWRPLLDVPRADLLAYAEAHSLDWIDDPSNADSRFSRNFLRNDVLPIVEARFPGASKGFARLGRLCGEASGMLDELAAIDLAALARTGSTHLHRDAALGLSSPRLRNLMRHMLSEAGESMPDEDRLRELERQFRHDEAAAGLRLPFGAVAICVYRDLWWLEPLSGEKAPACVTWNGELAMAWAGGQVSFALTVGKGVSVASIAHQSCTLRRRAGGERLRMRADGLERTLKNLFQEAGVPPWLRDDLPLLWVGEQLAWVAGLGVGAEFRCPPGEAGVVPVWSVLS